MERENEILHINEEVSTEYEISALMKAFDGGPILYFHNVKGYENNVVGGVCGAKKRICRALKTNLEKIYEKISQACEHPKEPQITESGSVMEVLEKPNLNRIPVLTHYFGDGGPYITSAIVSALSPDGEFENVSIHRLQVLDEKHLAIRLVPRHLHKLWLMAKEKGRDLDIAISIGVHPAISIASTAPVPYGVNEYAVANRLMNGRLKLIECPNVNAHAPADAEIILEARISASKMVNEGPLVDITGTHDIIRKQPLIEVLNVMHRENYIYQALLPGGSEHKILMGLGREVMIWKIVSMVVPHVKAVNLTVGGCGWLHAVISIEKQTDGDAKNAILAAFAAHPSLKHVVVVDADIDVYDPNEVEWAIATRFQGDEDLIVIRNVRGSTLDPSGDQKTGLTTKMGLDATKPLDKPTESFKKAEIPVNDKIKRLIDELKSIQQRT